MEATRRRRPQRRHSSKEVPVWTTPPPVRPAVPRSPETEPRRSKLPSWTELPAQRRRRLVAVLGELVLRARSEELRDEPREQGDDDERGDPQ